MRKTTYTVSAVFALMSFLLLSATNVFALVGAIKTGFDAPRNPPPLPVIRPQSVEGLNSTKVLIPITVENFENVDSFSFDVLLYGLVFIEFEDVSNDIVVNPPSPNGNLLSATYLGDRLTLPDGVVLFYISCELYGLPGMNRDVVLATNYLTVLGSSVGILPIQPASVHIIDPMPLTLHAESLSANVGEEVVMPITVSNFENIRQVNFSLSWDPQVAEYLVSDFVDPRISYLDADGSDGVIQGLFLSDPSATISDGSELTSLRFQLNEFAGSPAFEIEINEVRIGPPNVYYYGAQVVSGSFTIGQPTISVATVSGYQNTNVLVPVTADFFEHVNQFEFSLAWDKPGLTLNGIQNVLPGITVNVEEFSLTAMGENLDLSLPEDAILFYVDFNVNADPNTNWPIEISISSFKADAPGIVEAIGVSGEINVTVLAPTISVQSAEGESLSIVLVPVTVENFVNVEAFEFTITNTFVGLLSYMGVEEVHSGIVITEPPAGGNTLTASYSGGPLTLPDDSVLFYMAFQLYGDEGTDYPLTLDVTAMESWGITSQPPPPQVSYVHVTDPTPITIIAHDAVGYAGGDVIVTFSVSNFDEVLQLPFMITWDPSIATFQEFIGYPNVYVGDPDGNDGIVTGIFFVNPSSSLTEGDTLFELLFHLNDTTASTPINISSAGMTLVGPAFNYSGVETINGSLSSEPPLTLNLAQVSGERFSNVGVPMTVANFQNVNAASFFIRWDSTEVELNDVTFNVPTAWDSVHIESGIAYIGFNFAAAQDLNDGTELLNLSFELIGEYGDASRVAIDHYLPAEFVVNNLVRDGVVYHFGDVTINNLQLSGSVQYANQDEVANAVITATDFVVEDVGVTDDNGRYALQISGPGPTLNITPSKNNDPDPQNGLDMADVALLEKYLIAQEHSDIYSSYQVIAADVNNDQTVNDADANLLESIVLGDTTLPPNSVWKFVDASYAFADIHNPFPYPGNVEVPDYNDLLPGSEFNFVAVKTGDVNLSRDNTQQGRQNSLREVTLEVNVNSLGNGLTEVSVKSVDFLDIRGYQFTLSWNVDKYEILGDDIFSKGRYSSKHFENGHVSTSWQSGKEATFSNGTTLMTLLFQAKDGKSTPNINVNDIITPTKVFDATLSKLSVNVTERLMTQENLGIEVFPNPAVSTTQVIVYSNASQESLIEISDVNGRSLVQEVSMLRPGKNVLTIDAGKWAKGVYLLKFRTKTSFEIKKVVKQ